MLLEAAGGSPGPQGRALLPAAVVAAALESCRGDYAMLARDPARDLAIGPAPGRIHVHNMGEAPSVGDPRTGDVPPGDVPRPGARRHESCTTSGIPTPSTAWSRRATCRPSFIRCTRTSLSPPRPTSPSAARARITPGRRRCSSRWLRRSLSARPGEAPAGGVVLDMGYSPVSPLHLGAGVCDGIVAAAQAGDGGAGPHQSGRRHHRAGVARRRARAAGRRDPRRSGARAGRRAGHRLRVRRARLSRGRPARRPAALRLRTVVARLGGRDAARSAPRPRLRLLRTGRVGPAGRRAGRVPAGAAGARWRARAPVHDVRHRCLGRRLHVSRTARRRRRHLPRRPRCSRAAGLGRRRSRRGRDGRGHHRQERLSRHAPHAPLAAWQRRL